MFKPNLIKWTISLVVIALIIAVGVTINTDNPTFTPQTAIGQTSENFNQDFEYLERANRAFIEVVNRAKPAVVQITTTRSVPTSRSQRSFDFFGEDDFFEFWFGPRERREQQERAEPEEQEEVRGLGSGVIVSEEGYILTNNHVIERAEDIAVVLPNGREYKATVVGKDAGRQGTDLAVLKIDGNDLPTLPLGNSEELQIGEWVIAIGSPFGLAQTVTRGMVSAKGRMSPGIDIAYTDFIQTDAAINRGNSGGALINIRGELIGINTAIATGGGLSYGNVGVGFAIPTNLAKRIMTQLIDKGEVERGWLGVSLQPQPIDYDLAEKLNLETPRGALITQVYKGTPAHKAGIRRGDVIVEFDKVAIRDMNHLRHVVAAASVGETTEVKVIRKGTEKILKVKLEKRTQEVLAKFRSRGEPFAPDEEDVGVFANIYVQALTSELAARYGYAGETGVIVAAVERRSPAARAGIGVGTLIQEIEGVEITNLKDYREQIKAVKDKAKILLYVRQPNDRGAAFVTLDNSSN